MPLVTLPMILSDFDLIIQQSERLPPGCDLVANPMPFCWPVTTSEDAKARSTWHFKRQRQRYLEDNTAYYMKVIDTELACEIIGIARWNYHPNGYSFERENHWERIHGSDTEIASHCDTKFHDEILEARDKARVSWISTTSPCWILTHLVVRGDQQRRGIGGMLVRWGMERSRESQCPAYLEAGEQGLRLYEREGFEKVEPPISVTGTDDVVLFTMAKMFYRP